MKQDRYRVINDLKKWLEDVVGDRCPDFDEECWSCRAWRAYDHLELLAERAP